MSEQTTRTRVAIVGSGFAGLGAGIRLKQADVHDFVILEAGSEVGGTWRDNTYPGAACDIPSHLYSFSFEPRADWSRAYSPQDEIQSYLVHCADRYGLRDHLFLDTAVETAVYDEDAACWTLTTADGRAFVADVVISGIGSLREPSYPDIPGRDAFAGPTMHTARWDHDVDLTGKRIGVVGTGASAIQVVPNIAEAADQTVLFQRTPPWILPRNDFAYPAVVKAAFRHLPFLRSAHRRRIYWQKELRYVAFGPHGAPLRRIVETAARAYLRAVVRDPDLRETLTPDYELGCKRILISDDYLPALTRDDVRVCTDGIAEITPTGVVTRDGEAVDLDVLVFATGFDVRNVLGRFTVTGRGGKDLDTTWGEFPVAYLGTTVPDFPNLFVLTGPNTGLGHNSMVFMIESQLNYVMGAVDRIVNGEVAELDVRPDALDAFAAEVRRRHTDTVWASGCESWYLGDNGENWTLWPASTAEFRLRTARFDAGPYRVATRAELAERASSRSGADA